MISIATYSGIIDNCNMSDIGPLAMKLQSVARDGPAAGDACDDFVNQAFNQQGNINIYDIYADVCTASDNRRRLAGDDYPSGGVIGYDPCIDNKV